MISVLTQAVKEMNDEVISLKREIANLKNNNAASNSEKNESFIAQNIPNPFTDQTSIKYQLPVGTTNAQLLILNLNGNLVKTIKLAVNEKEITIKSSDIGKGLFI